MRRVIFISFMFLMFLIKPVMADNIELKTGEIIEGEIVDKTEEGISVDVGVGVPILYYYEDLKQDASEEESSQEEVKPEEEISKMDNISNAEEGRIIPDNVIPQMKSLEIDAKFSDWDWVPVHIVDEAGDVRKEFANKEAHEFDFTAARLAYKDNHLYLLMGFAEPLEVYFNKNRNHAKVIGTFFFDTDYNERTGGEEFFSKAGGFESQLEIWSGVGIKGSSSSVFGDGFLPDAPEDAEFEYFIKCIPSPYNSKKKTLNTEFKNSFGSDKNPELIRYDGNVLEVKIPFNLLGIDFNISKEVRIIFSEKGSGSWGHGKDTFSDEANLNFE